MKTKSKLSAYILRGSIGALLLSCMIVALCWAINLPEQPPTARPPQDNAVFAANGDESGALSFGDRVAYQRAIEEVYWRHRIWPRGGGERPDRKPSLEAVMSQATIEQKVQDYLRNSELEEWQKPITPEQLQAEMDRMAQRTKQPEVLHELFAALGNDPFVIAECLARPVLLERLQFAAAESRKEPLESWSATAQNQMPNVMAAAPANYTLPAISDGASGCIDDSWTATNTTSAPTRRYSHTAVWTGSEMIVWGGVDENFVRVNTGGRYNPGTDSWTATSTTNAPTARNYHTAVWTGSEMIVWGGADIDYANTGGRYNPSTDTWMATSTTNAPTGRELHTAVWTGSEMIVWGGFDSLFNYVTGGRYNPGTDSWTPTNTTNAPTAREFHTAVLTGSEMIVWGGHGEDGRPLNTGGRYNPSMDSWTATSTINVPTSRYLHTAVSTGPEMIVWGGYNLGDLDTGGRYNPSTDSWMATSTINVPNSRYSHTAVWTGSEMIIWAGFDHGVGDLNSGGRYNPSTDSWMATSTANAPSRRQGHTAVWTDSEMIVWGGVDDLFHPLNTGGRYCAQTGSPTPTPTPPPQITLRAEGRKVNGVDTVRLTWSGATSSQVDIYRCVQHVNGCRPAVIATTANDGRYIDSTGHTGQAAFRYKVCEAGTQTCSKAAGVTFQP